MIAAGTKRAPMARAGFGVEHQRDDITQPLSGRGTNSEVMFLLGWGAVDAVALLQAFMGLNSAAYVVAIHAVITGLGLWLYSQLFCNEDFAAIAGMTTLLLGPAGAWGTLILILSIPAEQGGSGTSSFRIARAHREARARDSVMVLYEDVVDGRAFRPDGFNVRCFSDIVAQTESSKTQQLLGTISQWFHPKYQPVLRAALISRDAAARVSAAAVLVKLREQYGSCYRAMHANADADPVFAARTLLRCARSGFLEPDQVEAARQRATDLLLGVRPIFREADMVEELASGLIAEAGDHKQIVDRLYHSRQRLSASLRRRLVEALMALGRYSDIPKVVGEASRELNYGRAGEMFE